MSDIWEDIRAAVVAKLAGSTGLAAAGLRGADTDAETKQSALPWAKVGRPAIQGDIERPNANVEMYDLRIPVEMLVARPAGTRRSQVNVSALMRAAQVEWRSGITLGLAPTVSWSFLESFVQEPDEYADTGTDGGHFEVVARVTETFSPARTA